MPRRTGTLGREVLDLDVDDSAFHSKLSGAYKSTTKFADDAGDSLMKAGKAISGVGNTLLRNVTVPIIAAGGAVAHFALDFDTTMRRIVGLAKVPAKEIAGIREEILQLGGDVGRSPQELGEAFYFVASAGFKAQEAMEVLRTAAKAAAAGMGATQDVAKVLGGVINAYGHENITAARAGDILTAAIQDGAAEASDFAGAIGMVVPNAAALGVSFDQVAAAMSAMTQVGIDAQTAAVNLGQILSALQKPSVQAEAAMEGLGLSSAGLRQELKEKGLLETLRTLEERFRGNETASALVFGNIRALRGVSALLGMDTKQLNGIFGDTATALGTLQGAYEDTEGPQRRIDRAMADLQASAIKLGTDVLPQVVEVIEELADGAQRLSRWWAGLSDETKKSLIQWLAWTAAAGPVLLVAGKLVSGLGALFNVIGFLAGSKGIPRLIGSMSKAKLVMGLWAIAIVAVAEGLGAAANETSDFFDELVNGKKANKVLHELIDLTSDMAKAQYLRAMGIDAEEFAEAVEKAGGDVQAAFDAIKDAGGDLGKAIDQLALDGDKAFGGMVTGFGRNLKEARAAVRSEGEGIPHDLAAELIDGRFVVGPAAEKGLEDPVDEALQKAVEDAGKRAQELIDALAGVLADGPQQIKDELKALREALENPYTTVEREADLQTALANKAVAANLKTGDKQAEALAAKQVEDWLDQYKLLEPGAFAAAFKVNPAFQSGVNSNLDATVQWMQDNVTGPIADKFDLADVLDAAGYDGLAAYVRGMERARIAKLTNEIANTVNQVKHDLSSTTDMYYAGRLITSEWMRGLLAGIQQNKYLLSIAMWDIRNHFGHSLPTKGPLAGNATKLGGLSIGDQWMEAIADAIAAGLRSLQGDVGTVANALALTPRIGMPALAGLSALGPDVMAPPAGATNLAGTTVTINDGIHFHDVGSDLSPEAKQGFAEDILDLVATGLQEQGSRYGSRPRVSIG